MKKKTKKAKRFTKQTQLQVRTGLKGGQPCESDANCTYSERPFCVNSSCKECRTDADCPRATSFCSAGNCTGY